MEETFDQQDVCDHLGLQNIVADEEIELAAQYGHQADRVVAQVRQQTDVISEFVQSVGVAELTRKSTKT